MTNRKHILQTLGARPAGALFNFLFKLAPYLQAKVADLEIKRDRDREREIERERAREKAREGQRESERERERGRGREIVVSGGEASIPHGRKWSSSILVGMRFLSPRSSER